MIEVFKTNVSDPDHANMLLEQIHDRFIEYRANFDLEDCDNILRVASANGHVEISTLIGLLENHGFQAQVLPD